VADYLSTRTALCGVTQVTSEVLAAEGPGLEEEDREHKGPSAA
jgi:hypothetical protein